MTGPTPTARPYAGVPADRRREDRRRRLLDAAHALYGEDEQPTTVTAVCAVARVSTSHFYELFANTDALLHALFDELARELLRRVAAASVAVPLEHEARVRAGVGAFVDALAEDHRLARLLLLVPHSASGAMLMHQRATVNAFADLVTAQAEQLAAAGRLPRRDWRLTSVALVGAALELMTAWFLADPRPPVGPVRDELVRMHLASAQLP